MKLTRRVLIAMVGLFVAGLLAPQAWSVDRFERLRSRVKSGVDFYRDGPFTISRLTKNPLSGKLTAVRGFLTNDTDKRAVSVQIEVTCYNEAGDLLASELIDVDYLGPRETRQFQVRIKRDSEEITLFEAAIQDTVWEDF